MLVLNFHLIKLFIIKEKTLNIDDPDNHMSLKFNIHVNKNFFLKGKSIRSKYRKEDRGK